MNAGIISMYFFLPRFACCMFFHWSFMWNTSKSGQCPPEFSLTFLAYDDKRQHWAAVSYLELKTSCMTFWLSLTVTGKKGAHVHVLKVSACSQPKEILQHKELLLTLAWKHSRITMIHMAPGGIQLYRQTLLFNSDKTALYGFWRMDLFVPQPRLSSHDNNIYKKGLPLMTR